MFCLRSGYRGAAASDPHGWTSLDLRASCGATFMIPRSTQTLVVVSTWRRMSTHAFSIREWNGKDWRDIEVGCEICGPVVRQLSIVQDAPAALYTDLCDEGAELFVAWRDAVEEWKEEGPGQGTRSRLGFVGLGPQLAARRAAALGSLPSEAFIRLLAVTDDAGREEQIKAVEAAYDRSGSAVRPERGSGEMGSGISPRRCQGPGCRNQVEKGRYCSSSCRMAARDADRPTLVALED